MPPIGRWPTWSAGRRRGASDSSSSRRTSICCTRPPARARWSRCTARSTGPAAPAPRVPSRRRRSPRRRSTSAPSTPDPDATTVPRCAACGALMRPHVLWFDEHYGSHPDYGWPEVLDACDTMRLAIADRHVVLGRGHRPDRRRSRPTRRSAVRRRSPGRRDRRPARRRHPRQGGGAVAARLRAHRGRRMTPPATTPLLRFYRLEGADAAAGRWPRSGRGTRPGSRTSTTTSSGCSRCRSRARSTRRRPS